MSPLCPSDISPKYDMKTVHDYFNLGGRIWRRKRTNTLSGTRPQADTSKLEEEIDHAQRVAPRQLYGLTEEEIKIVEGK